MKYARIIVLASAWAVLITCRSADAQFRSIHTVTQDVTTLVLGDASTTHVSTVDACANVVVSWTAGTDADSYRVQVRQGAGSWTDLYTETANQVMITDTTGYATGVLIEYRVFARNARSNWESSTPAISNSLTC